MWFGEYVWALLDGFSCLLYCVRLHQAESVLRTSIKAWNEHYMVWMRNRRQALAVNAKFSIPIWESNELCYVQPPKNQVNLAVLSYIFPVLATIYPRTAELTTPGRRGGVLFRSLIDTLLNKAHLWWPTCCLGLDPPGTGSWEICHALCVPSLRSGRGGN